MLPSPILSNTPNSKNFCVSLPFHEFQHLGRLLTNLSFSLSLSLGKREKGSSHIYSRDRGRDWVYQSPLTRLNTSSVICKRYEYGEDCGDVGCRGENSSKISFSLPTNRPHVLPPAGWLRGQPPTPPPITWRCFQGQHRCVNNPDALLW